MMKNISKLENKINSHCGNLEFCFKLIVSKFKSNFKVSNFLLSLCGSKK